MSAEKRDLDAAEFVLGTLSKEERQKFEASLSQDSGLRDAVDAWEQRLNGLDEMSGSVEPPVDLWQRIEANLGDDVPGGRETSLTVRATEGEWLLLAKGVEKKILLRDLARGEESFLLRIVAGTRLDAHFHRSTEECVLLEGDLSIGPLKLTVGDYHAALAGTDHPEIYSQDGALVFIRGELREAS